MHSYKERGHDLYETPEPATLALMKHAKLPTCLWEPACGRGAIVRPLRESGHIVYATDLIDYEVRDQDVSGWDFLMERQCPIGVRAIVTNPPFKLAAQFAVHALELCPEVFMLLRLNFLEAGNERTVSGRARLMCLDGGRLARVLVFRSRLPMMHRDGWSGKKATSSVPFAWFCWHAGHTGPTTVERIDW